MAASTNPVVAAGFIVFRRLRNQIEYLLLQASGGEQHWTPPKGHVDPGESELEAAYRETEEEAGLVKSQLTIVPDFEKTLNYTAWGKPKRVVYWLSELSNPEDPVRISHEHQSFQWAKFNEACQLSKFPDMIAVYKDANNFLTKKFQS